MIETVLYMFISGSVLSFMFFTGLWFTVTQAMLSTSPHRWFILSFMLRMTVLLLVFYMISTSGQWQYIASALLGFVVTRSMVIRILPTSFNSPPNKPKEPANAS